MTRPVVAASSVVRRRVALAVAMALLASLAGAAGADARGRPAPDPATIVWAAGGSNMGECSAFLGTLGLRDDVNGLIRQFGDVLGVGSPGELYRVRARQPTSLPPAEECLPRNL